MLILINCVNTVSVQKEPTGGEFWRILVNKSPAYLGKIVLGGALFGKKWAILENLGWVVRLS